MKIKKDDQVLIISGKDRGRKGKVLEVYPQKNRLVVEGLNLHKRHIRPKRSGEKGQIVQFPAPIDASNLKVAKDLSKVAEVRSLDKLKARFMIIDSEQIMFMLLDDESTHPNYDIGIWINTEFFAQALEQLFEVAWKNFKKI